MTVSYVSIVICSIDDARFAQVEAHLNHILSPIAHEIIRIPDATSLSEGYNRGWRRANGDWLIFCHDDIAILSPDFLDRFIKHCGQFDLFGPVGTTRLCGGSWFDAGKPFIHGSIVQPSPSATGGVDLDIFDESLTAVSSVQAVDGLFIAVRRQAVDALQGFDETLCGGFHLYDIEFSFRAHLAGLRCGCAGDILFWHASLPIGLRSQSAIRTWAEAKQQFDRRYARYLSPLTPGNYTFFRAPAASPEAALAIFQEKITS